jgi:hypothetical protein
MSSGALRDTRWTSPCSITCHDEQIYDKGIIAFATWAGHAHVVPRVAKVCQDRFQFCSYGFESTSN